MKEHYFNEYWHKVQVAIRKKVDFCRFQCPKRPLFTLFTKVSALFSHFQIMSDLGHSKSILGQFLHSWRKFDKKQVSLQKYYRHDPFRSTGFISIRYGGFVRRSQQWQKVRNLTFDPTCDVVNDVLINFRNIFGKLKPGAVKYRFRIENRSSSLAESKGEFRPPPHGPGIPLRGAG